MHQLGAISEGGRLETLLPVEAVEGGVWTSADGGDDAGGVRKGKVVRMGQWHVIPTGGPGQMP